MLVSNSAEADNCGSCYSLQKYIRILKKYFMKHLYQDTLGHFCVLKYQLVSYIVKDYELTYYLDKEAFRI